jgi:adenine-specific DNA-methyltransferase
MKNILDDLTALLSADDRLVSEGKLMKNKIIELSFALDSKLLKLLLSDENIKNIFFSTIGDIVIFDSSKFQNFVSNKQFLPDSYTAFKNKIGLYSGDTYIKESNDVVLAWAYKDCVLEGGQTKDESSRKEIFWNETLAPVEIDRLLSPKVFTNWNFYDKDGVKAPTEISTDSNLIIKGNNLLALHSLKAYRGKVKLICIDPPYNTTNDSFNYNDNFTHSSWLTFMKSRLEIAKDLLAPDGTIWIVIDEIEAHYLKVLCDQIFTRECFVSALAWRSADSSNQDSKKFSVDHNEILVYSKTPGWETQRLDRDDDSNAHYSNPDQDPRGDWFPGNVSSPNPRQNLKYKVKTPNGNEITFPKNGWRWSKERMAEMIKTKEIVFLDNETRLLRKTYLDGQKGLAPSSIWDDYEDTGHNRQAKYELRKLFPELNTSELFKTPKPERLIKRILEISTQKNDLVLDFFMGSATTCAVALKMGRRFIGVEQMDYIQDVSIKRLQRVIEGEQGGISTMVDWNGGGSFIYCELAQSNQLFADKILKSKTDKQLNSIWGEMKDKAFLSYRVDPSFFDKNKKEFSELSIEFKKKFLIELLDKNMLYIPLSEIDDATFGISPTVKNLNNQFYGLSNK